MGKTCRNHGEDEEDDCTYDDYEKARRKKVTNET
jgi:hypothetical protein